MDVKEKELIRSLTEAIDMLPESERKYMQGMADGITMTKAKDTDKDKENTEG